MTIGAFARATGLSIGALRHYAERGLLAPATVDDTTGYRYYAPDQVEPARIVATLRALDVDRLRMLMHHDHDLLTDREKIMPPSTFALDPDDERRLAATLFNHVWDLLGKPDRSIADDDAMLHAAHASRHHWGMVGTPMNFARGEWQCSRVYSVLGRFEPALHHGRRCLELATENDLSAFDVGIGHEAMARAYRVAGDAAAVAKHVMLADVEAEKVPDPEDRKILTDDLDALRAPVTDP